MSRARRSCTRAPSDRGAGTVLALGLIAVLLALTLTVVGLSRAVHARGAAQTAADLAALAAATALHAPGGPSAPVCGTASQVARSNGAALLRCDIRGDAVVVTTTVRTTGVPGGALLARAEARAGPV